MIWVILGVSACATTLLAWIKGMSPVTKQQILRDLLFQLESCSFTTLIELVVETCRWRRARVLASTRGLGKAFSSPRTIGASAAWIQRLDQSHSVYKLHTVELTHDSVRSIACRDVDKSRADDRPFDPVPSFVGYLRQCSRTSAAFRSK
jgi:hypothetical protein